MVPIFYISYIVDKIPIIIGLIFLRYVCIIKMKNVLEEFKRKATEKQSIK